MDGTQERKPRSYADLLALWDVAPVWQPPAPEQPQVGGAVRSSDLDLFTDRQIADALQIDVLGQTEAGDIEAYSSFLRRTMRFGGVSRLKYEDLLQLFGTPVRSVVSRTNEDAVPGMYPIRDVREMLGHLSSVKLIGEETKLGPGVWPVQDEAGRDQQAVVLVNTSEAMHYNGHVERITHPRHRGHLLSFESGANPWYDYDHLVGLLEQAKDKAWREQVVDDLVKLFRRWRWRGANDPLIVSGLVFATWVQAVWAWRPRIDVLGASNTGKSVLCGALAGLFRGLVIQTSDTTAAGLRQKIKNSAIVVIVDEVDAKNRAKVARQREILEMLRSASRGTAAIRGTGSGRAMEFTLRHLVWVAGISLSYDDQADRNRAVILNLLSPLKHMAGKLRIPTGDELQDLGQRALAAALWACQPARAAAVDLKDQKIEDVDQRLVESYAVPAAMLAEVLGQTGADAVGLLRMMLADAKEDIQVEADETNLIGEILGASVRMEGKELTVAQVIGLVCDVTVSNRDAWKTVLESAGVRIETFGRKRVIMQYQLVRKLLRGSRWAEQPIDQYLRRIPNAETCNLRVGGKMGRSIAFNLDEFRQTYIGDEQGEQPTQCEDGQF